MDQGKPQGTLPPTKELDVFCPKAEGVGSRTLKHVRVGLAQAVRHWICNLQVWVQFSPLNLCQSNSIFPISQQNC